MGEELPVLAMMRRARSSMETSSELPTLNTSPTARLLQERDEGADDVSHVAEAASLRAVPVDGERLAGEGLANQAGHNHAVCGALTRADRIEEPHDDRRQAPLPVVRVGKDLVDGFGGRVRPTGHCRRAQDAVRLLVEFSRIVLAVNLRRARHHHLAPVAVGSFEHNDGALDVGCKGVERLLDDQLHADGRGKVHDNVALTHHLVDGQVVEHRPLHKAEVRVVFDYSQVGQAAGGQRIEHVDLVTRGEQRFDEVGADEARPACYEVTRHRQARLGPHRVIRQSMGGGFTSVPCGGIPQG